MNFSIHLIFFSLPTLVFLLQTTPPATNYISTVSSYIDYTKDPCQDFYSYACGNWATVKNIPSQQNISSEFHDILHNINKIVKNTLENKSMTFHDKTEEDMFRSAVLFYESCMNVEKLNENGSKELTDIIKRLEAFDFSDLRERTMALASVHLLNVDALFDVTVGKSSRLYAHLRLILIQGSLGMGVMEWYEDEQRLEAYRNLIEKMFVNLGLVTNPLIPSKIVNFEKKLAAFRKSPTDMKKITEVYKFMDKATMLKMPSLVDWEFYYQIIGIGRTPPGVIVENAEYHDKTARLILGEEADVVKYYTIWKVINSLAVDYLSDEIVKPFEEYQSFLDGSNIISERWSKCALKTNDAFGYVLARYVIDSTFEKDIRLRMTEMIHLMKQTFREQLARIDWMDSTTRVRALEKLDKMGVSKIGYPDFIFDSTQVSRFYGTIQVIPNNFALNGILAQKAKKERDLRTFGKPVRNNNWYYDPSRPNAYYIVYHNEIQFPATFLQGSLYNSAIPYKLYLGAIGMIIGHEITHGFDDTGSTFDFQGKLEDWWTVKSKEKFNQRAQCMVDQYNQFKISENVFVNGKLTLGENIADSGGLVIAFEAWKSTVDPKQLIDIPGAEVGKQLSLEQLFFISFGQVWCSVETEKELIRRSFSEVHAPSRFRVNGSAMNHPGFASAFQCKPGQPMNPEKRCNVW